MPLTTNPARANFTLAGPDFEPINDFHWRLAPESEKRAYWRRLGEIAYQAKLRELRRGIDVAGKPFVRVRPKSRPDGASGPPLSPHNAASRFQRLLGFTVTASRCTLFWRAGWSRIVKYHAYQMGPRSLPVRDAVGLAPASTKRVKEQARLWWRDRHPAVLLPPVPPGPKRPKLRPSARPVPVPTPAPASAPRLQPGPRRTEQDIQIDRRRVDVARRAAILIRDRDQLVTAAGVAKERYDRLVAAGPFTQERSDARATWLAAEQRVSDVERDYNRLVEWEDRVKLNPTLIPAGPIVDRLADYVEGDELVARLAQVGMESRRLADIAAQAERELFEFRRGLAPGDLRKKAVRAEVARLKEAVDRTFQDYNEAIGRPKADPRAALIDVLGRRSRLDLSRDASAITDESLRVQIDQGESFVRLVLDDPEGTNRFMVHYKQLPAGGRANAGGTIVSLSPTDPAQAVVHEIGHVIEDQVQGGTIAPLTMGELGREFLAHRTAGEVARPLGEVFPGAGYRPDEVARKDRFDQFFLEVSAWYAGKEYSNRSEIISMGLEALYADPARFARDDPEYAKFMIGVLRGDLR